MWRLCVRIHVSLWLFRTRWRNRAVSPEQAVGSRLWGGTAVGATPGGAAHPHRTPTLPARPHVHEPCTPQVLAAIQPGAADAPHVSVAKDAEAVVGPDVLWKAELLRVCHMGGVVEAWEGATHHHLGQPLEAEVAEVELDSS
jgi:hypothetical protein